MNYELTLERFKGPMDALLALIEERKLEITEISLAQITEDFLKFLQELQVATKQEHGDTAALRQLADFIVVASRLILIKSKSLLPDLNLTQEEQEQIKDLEERLRLYRQLKPAMRLFQVAWKSPEKEMSRPYFWNIFSISSGWGVEGARFFYPGNGVTTGTMTGSLSKLFEGLEKFTREEETIQEKVISLEEEMKSLVARLSAGATQSLSGLSHNRSRAEVVVLFLAILHLVRDQLVSVSQENRFSDILISSEKNGEGNS